MHLTLNNEDGYFIGRSESIPDLSKLLQYFSSNSYYFLRVIVTYRHYYSCWELEGYFISADKSKGLEEVVL